jgi:hypothetical protein
MVDRALRIGAVAPLLTLASAFCGLVGTASANLIASDSYSIGTSPSSGQYQAGSVLMTQPPNLTTLGFANGGYGGGTGTSQFGVTSGGLSYPPIGPPPANDGKVTVTGTALGMGYKSVARSLSPIPVPTSPSYFFSMLIRSDGVASVAGGGYVLAGFGNLVQPVPGPTNGFLAGLYLGFAQDTGHSNDTGDLIIRYRTPDLSTPPPMLSSDAILVDGSKTNTVGQTYMVVAELDPNSSEAIDKVSYWVNPTKFDSVDSLTSSSLAAGSFNSLSFQVPGDFARLTFAENNWNVGADFDEVKMGTTLADVVPAAAVPEPGSLILVGIGIVGGLGARVRRRARD